MALDTPIAGCEEAPRRPRKDRTIQICVAEEEYQRWQRLAYARDISVSQLIRDRMRQYRDD